MKLFVRFLINLFLSGDQLVNTLTGGHPDETISSRLGRTINRERYFWVKPLRLLVDKMFFFDTDVEKETGRKIYHCEKSIMSLEQQNFREMIDYEIWSWSK